MLGINDRSAPEIRELGRYVFAGSTLTSDYPFADLHPADRLAPPALEVRGRDGGFPALGALVRMVADGDIPVLRAYENGQGIQWLIRGVGRVWLHASGGLVEYELAQDAQDEDIETYLGGPVLGVAAQQRGETLLHASSVPWAGGAVAFSAPSGLGKSTLAASFTLAGHPLMSDDILPVREIDGRWMATPFVPKLKLWDESLEGLGVRDVHEYARAFSWLDKRRVDVGKQWGQVATGDLPLKVLYLLRPHLDEARREVIEIAELQSLQAVLGIQGAMYMPEMLRGQRARHALDASARLATEVSVREVAYYRSFPGLERLRERLLEDSESLT